MRESDRHILSFLYNDGDQIVATPRVIAANISFAPGTVRDRMRPLREAGLLAYADQTSAIYRLAELGKRYMHDQLTPQEIDDIEDVLA